MTVIQTEECSIAGGGWMKAMFDIIYSVNKLCTHEAQTFINVDKWIHSFNDKWFDVMLELDPINIFICCFFSAYRLEMFFCFSMGCISQAIDITVSKSLLTCNQVIWQSFDS